MGDTLLVKISLHAISHTTPHSITQPHLFCLSLSVNAKTLLSQDVGQELRNKATLCCGVVRKVNV